MEQVSIEGDEIRAVSPEGKVARMSLEALFDLAAPRRMESCGTILPDGVKLLVSEGPVTVWVHQAPPRVYNFRWIKNGSPAQFGPGTEYRNVRVAVPYVVVLAVFVPDGQGRLTLSKQNECFFRTEPLSSLSDPLCYPALLNCSKMVPQEGHPLAWICTQHLDRSFDQEPDSNRRMRAGLKSLLHCLLETGFNYSSEHHEASSWFTESRSVDPRIATVEAWEAASVEKPLFVLEVPWLKTGLSLGQVIDRIIKNNRARRPPLNSATALARFIFNHNQSPPTP